MIPWKFGDGLSYWTIFSILKTWAIDPIAIKEKSAAWLARATLQCSPSGALVLRNKQTWVLHRNMTTNKGGDNQTHVIP